jgi:hypothetical protein
MPSLKKIDKDAQGNGNTLDQWLENLAGLINSARSWAEELGWSTRIIEKTIEDSEVGNHQAPALLMQKEMVRALLEPIGRSGPGFDGVVDFYLLPAYDDIASLFFYKHGWHLHYPPPGHKGATKGKPVSKANFRKVLEEMTQNAQ